MRWRAARFDNDNNLSHAINKQTWTRHISTCSIYQVWKQPVSGKLACLFILQKVTDMLNT